MIIIAVGPGRCGTKSFAKVARSAGAMAHHEPEPKLEQFTMDYQVTRDDVTAMNRLIDLRDPLIKEARQASQPYCESAYWMSYLIPLMHALTDDLRVVVLTRELLDWGKSAFRRGWYDTDTEKFLHKTHETLRCRPAAGWPEGVDRWFKLGWYYQNASLAISEGLRGVNWIGFRCEHLSSTRRVRELCHTLDLPGWEKARPRRDNEGDAYVSVAEYRKAGVGIEGDVISEYAMLERKPQDEGIPYYYDELSDEQRMDSLQQGTLHANRTFRHPVVPEAEE